MRRIALLLALLLAAAPAWGTADAIPITTLTSSDNLVGLTLTNNGFLGTNLSNGYASFEYPRGSMYEHLVHAGLWFGALRVDSGFVGVSTAATDMSAGASMGGSQATEFMPLETFVHRSTLPWEPWFSWLSKSEEDIVCRYGEWPFDALSAPSDPTRPLGIEVRQSAFAWSFGAYAHVLFLRYVVRNVGGGPLANAWVGLYSELASGSIAGSSSFPPVGWFAKKWLVAEPSQRLIREHYCQNRNALPANCQLSRVPYWAGVQLLTAPQPGQFVTMAGWSFAPGAKWLGTDSLRYARMSTGLVTDFTADSLLPVSGDPVELLALGPFPTLAAGDSLTVDFAFVGGSEVDTLRENAYQAQVFHDADFPAGGVGTRTSLLSADAEPGRVRVRWEVAGGAGPRATIERTGPGVPPDWKAVAQVTPTSAGLVEYVDRDVVPGGRYGYRLLDPAGVVPARAIETWITVPLGASFALHGVDPAPVTGDASAVRFALADAAPARLECFDLLGRREGALELGAIGAGEHAVPLVRLAALRPGLHLVRLTQGARQRSLRVVVVR